MCVVSNIGGYYEERYPQWPGYPLPRNPPKKSDEDTAEKMRKFLDLIKKGEEADKIMGEPDCETGDVKKFIKEVRERLDKIEKQLPKKRKRKARR